MSFSLTSKQKRLLDFIKAEIDAKGIAPSMDEMLSHLGASSRGSLHRIVCALEDKGYIRRMPNRARAIEIISPSDPVVAAQQALLAIGAVASSQAVARVVQALLEAKAGRAL